MGSEITICETCGAESEITICETCGAKFKSREEFPLWSKILLGVILAPFTFGLSLIIPFIPMPQTHCRTCMDDWTEDDI
jgi:hypothetical protein